MDKWDRVIHDSLEQQAEEVRSFKFKGQVVRHFKGDIINNEIRNAHINMAKSFRIALD